MGPALRLRGRANLSSLESGRRARDHLRSFHRSTCIPCSRCVFTRLAVPAIARSSTSTSGRRAFPAPRRRVLPARSFAVKSLHRRLHEVPCQMCRAGISSSTHRGWAQPHRHVSAPMTGLLAMTVALSARAEAPILFVPVYFGYERLLAGRNTSAVCPQPSPGNRVQLCLAIPALPAVSARVREFG